MAIHRTGPPKGPLIPRGPLRKDRAQRTSETSAAHGPDLEDSFEEHEEREGARERPVRPRAPIATSLGKTQAILRQALERLDDEVARRQAEIERIRALIGSQGASEAAFSRHQKKLARMRSELAAAKKRSVEAHRAMGELERGLAGIDASALAELDETLDEIASEPDGDARAFMALSLALELGAEEPSRRLKLKGAARGEALAYAEGENPTSILQDLASGVGGEAPEAEDPKLGRSLSAQRRLGSLARRGPGGKR
ncbi:MAG: hypothetical protein U1E65_26860 [Myxococcota bacterium]